jgi:hypothetical protein
MCLPISDFFPSGRGMNADLADLLHGSRFGFIKKTKGDRTMYGRTILKCSTLAAALIFVGHVATAAAAESRTHRNFEMETAAARGGVSAPVTRIDQDGNYVIDRTPGAVPNSSH